MEAEIVTDSDGTWLKLSHVEHSTWSFRFKEPAKDIRKTIAALEKHLTTIKTKKQAPKKQKRQLVS
ncbi:hypothetical protein LCGC14_1348140 [marine sediment metagenome]|uniref:Uncharacterized protein n=1 Tax=marine sediment metagenome TaxID=412755 RepID=A0A0F9KXR0_9ZZZZ